jgi:methylated-DNA-[protein]-cysteine S-methyltransferase
MIDEQLFWGDIKTLFGRFTAFVDHSGRLVIFWLSAEEARPLKANRLARLNVPAIAHVERQVQEYCAGERKAFDLELAPRGTKFQQKVWRALPEIPFGQTTSYGALAAKLGQPGAARAVGGANGCNPIGLIIPCHRVIGSDGRLTGYGGGLPLKRALLAHEAEVAGGDLFAIAARPG